MQSHVMHARGERMRAFSQIAPSMGLIKHGAI